jgi:hypothetical protein
MNPVPKITPAANALMRKNASLSGCKYDKFLTKNGRQIPSALANKIEDIAMSLYLSASDVF